MSFNRSTLRLQADAKANQNAVVKIIYCVHLHMAVLPSLVIVLYYTSHLPIHVHVTHQWESCYQLAYPQGTLSRGSVTQQHVRRQEEIEPIPIPIP